MVDGDSESPSDVLSAYRARRAEDSMSGKVRSSSEYLAMFPGLDAALVNADAATTTARRGTIGSYRCGTELGRGGQAVVYLAVDERLNRKVALKVLRDSLSASWKREARFFREAELTAKLDHPGICPVYEVGEEDGVAFIAMQYVEGEPLSERIRSTRTHGGSDAITPIDMRPSTSGSWESEPSTVATRGRLDDILRFVEKIARALHFAHEKGLVHRDVKPGNIMVATTGDPVVLDFGLARDLTHATMTSTDEVMGTPAYMSPEHLDADTGRVDRRSDVFSLGVTLFECLTTRRPFEGPTREALYRAIVNDAPPSLRALDPTLPPDLEVVVNTALAKDRNHRYQTSAEFADDLRRVRRREPIHARPPGAAVRMRRWAQRNPVVAGLLTLLLLSLTTLAAFATWKNREIDGKNRALTKRDEALTAALADATTQKDRVTSLKDRRELRLLLERADALYPPAPARIPALERWLRDADALQARLADHRAHKDGLESGAGPYTEAQRLEDHPEAWPRLLAARDRARALEAAFDAAETDAEEDRIEGELESQEATIEKLTAETDVRRSWGFDAETAWRHELLQDLVNRLERLGRADGVVADVRTRLATSRAIGPRTIDDHAEAWAGARERIRERHDGLDLEPQLGLIPLGPDPTTGLEEFVHWISHEEGAPFPRRDAGNRLVVGPETGIVLVLIPGGRAHVGAVPDVGQPNHDPEAQPNEAPVHTVRLDPYFISKYEMTQGQWARVRDGARPSYYAAGRRYGGAPVTLAHPVEQVSWIECDEVLRRIGLELPTEAQWEHATRAGTKTPWSSGPTLDELGGAANIGDEGSASVYPPMWKHEPGVRDGYAIHAPVGRLAANPFGLHDVHGNVREWCRDPYGSYEYPARPGDGLRTIPNPRHRSSRGGSFYGIATHTRTTNRMGSDPTLKNRTVGLRPARACR